MPFNQMLFGMRYPTGSATINFQSTGVLTNYASLYNVIQPGTMQNVALLTRAQWESLLPGAASMQLNCNMVGFNLVPNGSGPATGTAMSTRIGYVCNQEADCNTPDSFIG